MSRVHEFKPVQIMSSAAAEQRLAVLAGCRLPQTFVVAIHKTAVCTCAGHTYCTTALAFSGNLLASGAKDSRILLRDVRCPAQFVARFTAHK